MIKTLVVYIAKNMRLAEHSSSLNYLTESYGHEKKCVCGITVDVDSLLTKHPKISIDMKGLLKDSDILHKDLK